MINQGASYKSIERRLGKIHGRNSDTFVKFPSTKKSITLYSSTL